MRQTATTHTRNKLILIESMPSLCLTAQRSWTSRWTTDTRFQDFILLANCELYWIRYILWSLILMLIIIVVYAFEIKYWWKRWKSTFEQNIICLATFWTWIRSTIYRLLNECKHVHCTFIIISKNNKTDLLLDLCIFERTVIVAFIFIVHHFKERFFVIFRST